MRSPIQPRHVAHNTYAFAFALLYLAIADAHAEAGRAAPREVRFTGPLVSGAPPLPRGLFNIEPYLIDTQVVGYYDEKRNRHDIDRTPDGWNLVVPMQYGVTERLTLGATLSAGLASTTGSGRHLETGDTGLSLSWLLAKGDAAHAATLTFALRQNLATGTHDDLERHGLAEATGTGAPSTRVGLYGQAYFLPERTLRGRINLSWRVPGARAAIDGTSAYGTPAGFSGHAELASAMQASIGLEYSLSPTWVLATDLVYERDRGAHVAGVVANADGVRRLERDVTAWWRQSVAPAVEYHWSDRVGLIAGALVSVEGRNSAAIVSPQIALNMVF
ncbi:MAG TPA: hypothetical protein VGD42_01550 [Lysobacter sp.]